jgi:Spy/CpxP family protein refolding chaperone
MRSTTIATLILVTSLSVLASTGAAQESAQNPPPQPPPAQSAPDHRGPVTIGAGMMTPEMMQAMGPMIRTQSAARRGQESGGPIQSFSRLMATIDDPRVRTMLGLSDQQGDSLRKIVVDTETFTIKTGAVIAVDSIELRELLRADKPDRTAVMSKGDEISKSTSQLINHYLDAILSAKAILTPEQQKMIREYIATGAPTPPPPPRP